jgi:hypothetical protein
VDPKSGSQTVIRLRKNSLSVALKNPLMFMAIKFKGIVVSAKIYDKKFAQCGSFKSARSSLQIALNTFTNA